MDMREDRLSACMGVLLVLFLLTTTSTALILTAMVHSQSQVADPGTQLSHSQRMATAEVSPSSLSINWLKQQYASDTPAVVADVDNDGRPEILVETYYTVICLSGTGDVEWEKYVGGYPSATPAVGDINGDGRMEIVIAGDIYGRLIILNSSSPSGWVIQNINASFSYSSPTVADVDQDGKDEIVIGSDGDVHGNCRLFCINGEYAVEWSYPMRSYYSYGFISFNPTVADIQGDGTPEVLVTDGNRTYCLSGAGVSVWNFTAQGGARYSPAAADVDGDGKKEVVVGQDDGNVYCLNASGGLRWAYTTGSPNHLSYASVKDIDSDGKQEILFSNREASGLHSGTAYCLNATGGLEWLFATGGGLWGPPVAADIDVDGDLEVVFGTSYVSPSGNWAYGGVVYCLESSGREEWTYATGYYTVVNPLAVADIDSEGRPEIIVPTRNGVFCLSAFPEPPSIPGSLLLVLIGLSLALISITCVTIVRRGGRVQTASMRRRIRHPSGQRRSLRTIGLL